MLNLGNTIEEDINVFPQSVLIPTDAHGKVVLRFIALCAGLLHQFTASDSPSVAGLRVLPAEASGEVVRDAHD